MIICVLTEDGVVLYLSLALSCMPNAIFLAASACSSVGSDRPQTSSDVSTLNHDILQLAGQQWWSVHYSTDPDFQHRLSRRCHILQDDRSAASPSLLVVVLRVLPDIPSRVSSFHIDCAGNLLQPTSTEKISIPFRQIFVFPMMSRKCSIFSAWSTDVFADHFLPVLVWIPAPGILFLLNPATSLPSGIWLPWNLPPQRILVSLFAWSYRRVRSM